MKKIYYGTYKMPKEKMKENIKTAINAGYFGVDTALVYKNEEVVGQAVEELTQEGIDIKIQTKIWTADFDNVRKAFMKQLKSLRVSKVYSLLLHRPSLDFAKSIKAWKVLIELQKEGLVEYIGVSNFEKEMIRILIKETGVKPAANQIELSITNFRHDRVWYNQKENIEVQGWSPMGKDINKILKNSYLVKLADAYNVSPAVIAISYLTSQNIVPILASSNPKHIVEMKDLVELTKDEINKFHEFNIYDNKYGELYPS